MNLLTHWFYINNLDDDDNDDNEPIPEPRDWSIYIVKWEL